MCYLMALVGPAREADLLTEVSLDLMAHCNANDDGLLETTRCRYALGPSIKIFPGRVLCGRNPEHPCLHKADRPVPFAPPLVALLPPRSTCTDTLTSPQLRSTQHRPLMSCLQWPSRRRRGRTDIQPRALYSSNPSVIKPLSSHPADLKLFSNAPSPERDSSSTTLPLVYRLRLTANLPRIDLHIALPTSI